MALQLCVQHKRANELSSLSIDSQRSSDQSILRLVGQSMNGPMSYMYNVSSLSIEIQQLVHTAISGLAWSGPILNTQCRWRYIYTLPGWAVGEVGEAACTEPGDFLVLGLGGGVGGLPLRGLLASTGLVSPLGRLESTLRQAAKAAQNEKQTKIKQPQRNQMLEHK